jgi:putative hydrolase
MTDSDAAGLFSDPEKFAAALREMADVISWQGGPVNWRTAKQQALECVAENGDPGLLDADRSKAVEALRLADLWLEDATDFPSGIKAAQAWTRSEWVEATLPGWSQLCNPIAERAVAAVSALLDEDPAALAGDPEPELRTMVRSLAALGVGGLLKNMSGMLVGGMAGVAIGSLADDMAGTADMGLPLGPAGTAALLPAGVAAFGADLPAPPDEVQLFLALREVAYQRLFGHVPWLRARLLDALQDYVRGITPDFARLFSLLDDDDRLADDEALDEVASDIELFRSEDTEQQRAARMRLGTALAVVEGWVSTVVAEPATRMLPSAGKLAQVVSQRKESGEGGESGLARTVGLDLRPQRLPEATAIWREVTRLRGISGRDALWAHPDLLPTADDLDDPASFAAGRPALDISGLEQPGETAGSERSRDDDDDGAGPPGAETG